MIREKRTISNIAAELKRDKRTIAALISEANIEPVDSSGRYKRYYLCDVVSAMLNSKELDLQQERAKLAAKQSEKTSIQIDEMKGRLIDADEAERAWTKYVSSCRAKLLSIPTKLAADVVQIDNLQTAKDVLKKQIHEALTELASA